MNPQEFLNGLEIISDKHILEFVYVSKKKTLISKRVLAICASVAIMVAGIVTLVFFAPRDYNVRTQGVLASFDELDTILALYDGELLTEKIDFSKTTRSVVELYYAQEGRETNCNDWCFLTCNLFYSDYRIDLTCYFNVTDSSLKQWRNSDVYVENTEQTCKINATEVYYVALPQKNAYYSVFSFGGVIYEARIVGDGLQENIDFEKLSEFLCELLG